jgi:hypothetical protein
MSTSPNPCDGSLLSRILAGNAVVCSDTFKQYETKSATGQIQSVADNAATNYGADSVTAQVAQQTATAQEAQVPLDTSNITQAVAASSAGKVFGADCNGEPGLDLSIVGGPCLTYTLLREIGLGVLLAATAGMILYGVAIFGPLIPKGRN